jgi:hypothetical protein
MDDAEIHTLVGAGQATPYNLKPSPEPVGVHQSWTRSTQRPVATRRPETRNWLPGDSDTCTRTKSLILLARWYTTHSTVRRPSPQAPLRPRASDAGCQPNLLGAAGRASPASVGVSPVLSATALRVAQTTSDAEPPAGGATAQARSQDVTVTRLTPGDGLPLPAAGLAHTTRYPGRYPVPGSVPGQVSRAGTRAGH